MRWLVKAALQRGFSALPRGASVNYFFQRRVSRRLPRSGADWVFHAGVAAEHWRLHREHASIAPARARCYEFGAGWDLIGSIVGWGLGLERQTLVDIRPNLRLELINHTLATYASLRPELERELGIELRALPVTALHSACELTEHFGIEYLAPCDARSTGLPAGSVDLVSSTFTLEHIPADDIAAILVESRRLLASDGLLISTVDLKDHYSYFQPSLSPYNFLRFAPAVWRLANPPLHYQNRLRYPRYRALHEDAGFEILAEEADRPTASELAELEALRLARPFSRMSLDDVGVKTLQFVARPMATETSSRQQRERDFHNETFAEDNRARAAKFYAIHRASEAAYDRQVHEHPDGKDVLEYGCGRGSAAFDLAAAGARVTGIDISDVAIDIATQRGAEEGLADRLRFCVMDAERLEFEDASFDLVCGSAILHHLDLERAYSEIARVLRPGGRGVFVEALGHNPLINLYRRRTPDLRTVDEHPLRVGELELARRYFSDVSFEYFHLASLAALPLREQRAFPAVVGALERVDQALFRQVPYLRRHAWMALLRLER